MILLFKLTRIIMASIIQRLPIELKRVIYNYVRPMQKSELLYDIRNYKYSSKYYFTKEKD